MSSNNSITSRLAIATPLVAGPALMAVGVVLMMMPSAWTVSHLIFLAGTLTMIPAAMVIHELVRGISPSWLPRVGLWLAVTGALALSSQFVIDLAVMELANGNRDVAGEMFDQIQQSSAFSLTLYIVGPALLFVGLAVFGAAMIIRSRRWIQPGWILVTGALLMGLARVIGSRPTEVAALVIILIALACVAALADSANLPRAHDAAPITR
jgi:hypothetical protein